MSRKHFNPIAAAFKVQVTKVLAETNKRIREAKLLVLNDTVAALCDEFVGLNPRFDRQRFFQACGL